MDNKAQIQITSKWADFSLPDFSWFQPDFVGDNVWEKMSWFRDFQKRSFSQHSEKAKQLLTFKNIVEILDFIFIHSIQLFEISIYVFRCSGLFISLTVALYCTLIKHNLYISTYVNIIMNTY